MTKINYGFENVDATPTPQAYLDYLDQVEALAPMAAVREHTYAALPEGGRGVDVGCGRGRAVADLTERGRHAVGADRSQTMVDSARLRYPACRFLTGDATALPFDHGSLRWYRAERTYLHIPQPLQALAEARRVLAPGGHLVIADQDFDSIGMTSAEPSLTRTVVTTFTDSLANGHAGTQTPSLLIEAGFTDITVHALPLVFTDLATVTPLIIVPAVTAALEAGSLTPDDVTRWHDALEDADRAGAFIFTMTMFITTARRS